MTRGFEIGYKHFFDIEEFAKSINGNAWIVLYSYPMDRETFLAFFRFALARKCRGDNHDFFFILDDYPLEFQEGIAHRIAVQLTDSAGSVESELVIDMRDSVKISLSPGGIKFLTQYLKREV